MIDFSGPNALWSMQGIGGHLQQAGRDPVGIMATNKMKGTAQ